MNAESIATALGGRKAGRGWSARCPAHDDRNPSLSLRDSVNGGVWVRCFTGCPRDEVVASLKAMGLWTQGTSQKTSRTLVRQTSNSSAIDDQKRTNYALSVWDSSVTAQGTLVETYLGSRGLCMPQTNVLRYQRLNHPSGGIWSVMVALVTRGGDNTPIGIHRTYLSVDGAGKAPVNPQKMMLGLCAGGAVRLAEPTDVLMIGEGIETCLAAMQTTGLPAWAALSTSGLKSLELPDTVRDIIVLADGDDAGEAAAQTCAKRWIKQGRRVRIARPPNGLDFNDLLVNTRTAGVAR
jgi:putative DNA primase/helicase